MAQRVNIVLVDDVDGTPADETVEFSLDGIAYEIDLSGENARQLRADLGSWADKARVASKGGRKARAKAVPATKRSARQANSGIREWARDNGYQVSDRGRVPAEVKAAYEAAQR